MRKPRRPAAEEIDQRVFHAELCGLAIERGYKPGWAAHQFKAKFGDFPSRDLNHEPAVDPSLQTRRWVKSRQIAWWRARQKQRAAS